MYRLEGELRVFREAKVEEMYSVEGWGGPKTGGWGIQRGRGQRDVHSRRQGQGRALGAGGVVSVPRGGRDVLSRG